MLVEYSNTSISLLISIPKWPSLTMTLETSDLGDVDLGSSVTTIG